MSGPDGDGPAFEALLEHIHRTRGFDFTGYKRPSLRRRVAKRLQAAGVNGPEEYVDHLEVHPDEFGLLFDTILINVTDFFRDPPAWQVLTEEVVPRLLGSKRPEEPIRLWCAGCAFGEEAYSLAMALAEALGPDGFRDRVKIYATDVADKALDRARSAQYDAKDVLGIPADLLAKYFEPTGNGRSAFRKDFRRGLIFGRHDLIQDQIRPSLLSRLAGDDPFAELTLDAVNRRGRATRCRVNCSPMVDGEGPGKPVGAVLLFEAEDGGAVRR